jgi:hypothetical protein
MQEYTPINIFYVIFQISFFSDFISNEFFEPNMQ